jgi:hypothetical protein
MSFVAYIGGQSDNLPDFACAEFAIGSSKAAS